MASLDDMLCLASGNQILVYGKDLKLFKKLQHPNPVDADINWATDAFPSPFNAIRSGKLGDQKVLVGCDDAGQVL